MFTVVQILLFFDLDHHQVLCFFKILLFLILLGDLNFYLVNVFASFLA